MTPNRVEYPPQEIFLCSREAVNLNEDYFNDCSWQLPYPVVAPEGYSLYVQLIDLTIPVSWHVINEYCNQIVINGTEYLLSPGNYSLRPPTLLTALNALLPGITATFNEITLKLTLTSTTPFTISGTLCSILGIIEGSSGTVLSSKHTVDLTSQNSIYILSDFSSSNANIDTSGKSNVFCRIPVNVAPMQVLQHEDYNGKSGLLIDSETIGSVHFQLLDEDYRPLLNTLHWQATLQVSFIYTGRMHLIVDRPFGLRISPEELI
jgi:hypothetical protein